MALPSDRFCNLIWYWLTRNTDADGRRRQHRDLYRPPPGVTVAETVGWDADDEMADFARAAAATSPR